MTKLLFVCMGNICRSPTAHGVMLHKIERQELSKKFFIDSAGTHAYHVGEQSDARSRALATSKGIDMEMIRARKISIRDYDEFDYIFAMDDDNLELINYYAPESPKAKIELFLESAFQAGLTQIRSVPDPYYGGSDGFSKVFELVELGSQAIIDRLA